METLVALSALSLLPTATFFSLPLGPSRPSAFVAETVVLWSDHGRSLLGRSENTLSVHLSGADHITWEKAALSYEKILGIPSRFFLDWHRGEIFMASDNDDWEDYDHSTGRLVPWAAVDRAEDVCIEGGKFDAASIYVQLMQRKIRKTKEEILKLFEESDTLELPRELQVVQREDLLDSNMHDAIFLFVLNRMIKEPEKRRILTWKDSDIFALKDLLSDAGNSWFWFRSLSEIRQEAYFPSNNTREGNIQRALDETFDGFEYYKAAQKHLVKHLDTWRANTDLIPQLFDISVDLLWRHHSNEFLTEEAMALEPKDLLVQEREAILDMPFEGLESLEDTSRVKVLRTEREVKAVEMALNNTSFLHPSGLAICPWGGGREVAAALYDKTGNMTAVGEFTFKGCSSGGRIAKLGGGSSVTILLQNGQLMKNGTRDNDLIELCSHYHRDFLYGWRLEHLEAKNPSWWNRQKEDM